MDTLRPARPAARRAATTVLEASAGTGKTFALAGLVTRYVAEGEATLDQMLVITFGRAASQELRERVRAPAGRGRAALDDPSSAGDNPVDRAPARRQRRRARDRRRSGCATRWRRSTPRPSPPPTSSARLVLSSLGVAGDTDTGATLVESLDDLVVEIVDDLYLRHFGQRARRPAVRATPTRCAGARGRRAPGDRAAAEGRRRRTRAAAVCVDFAHDVLAELERRKRRLGILGYDDLLSRLADALEADDAPARRGCGSAGRSCWSTSSRTPTRCSGRCSTARSPATPRWC